MSNHKIAVRDAKLLHKLLQEDSSLSEEDRAFIVTMTMKSGLNEKPITWSNSSTAAYYKPKFALWLKPSLDKMISNPLCDVRMKLADYPGITVATLGKRVEQSWAYLMDHADPTGVYANLRTLCKVCPEGMNISIRWKLRVSTIESARLDLERGISTVSKEGELIPRLNSGSDSDEEGNSNSQWRKKLDNFLDNAQEGEELKIDSVILEEDDQEFVYEQIVQAPDMALKEINHRGFHVVCSIELGKKWHKMLI